MMRKDSEKDERPHYYSQFWLDVAAGRRTIGAPKTAEETELIESEPEPEPATSRRSGRASGAASSQRYEEPIAHPEVEPMPEEEVEFEEPEPGEMELGEDVEDRDIPNMLVDETGIPDMELAPLDEIEEEEQEEPVEDFFDEEEEDEDMGWGGGRGRKKPKPGRQTRMPKKSSRRDRKGY